jgi:hypothetical protein
MSTNETLEGILKDCGPVSLCKAIVDRGRSPCGEAELVAAIAKFAAAASGEREDVAFARMHENPTVANACRIAKAAEFSVFDIKAVVIGGEDAFEVNNATAAARTYEEIARIGREKFPFLPADQQFARVFEDKNYAALSAQAHSRPQPTTIYRPPASQGTAYTKSADPAPNTDTAYAALMAKAAEYQRAHPELTEAQAFAAIYTDRANIELAKRERIESAPR